MCNVPNRENLHKIVILNSKGGSGKTTLATNLASFYATRGRSPTLMDCDPQGYSMRWLDRRPADRPKIHGVAAFGLEAQPDAKVQLSVWPGSEELIIDLPAALPHDQLFEQTYDADSILIPVLPSTIDVYAASRLIAELLLIAQFDRRDRSLAIVANRTRQNTRSYRMLKSFLASLRIPLIAELRDSQNYVHAAGEGIGIHEMPQHLVKKDIVQMEPVIRWLDHWRMRKLDGAVSPNFEHIPGTAVLTPAMYKSAH